MAASRGIRIDEIIIANEAALRSLRDMRADGIWSVVRASTDRGLHRDGKLPWSIPRSAWRAGALSTAE